MDQIQLLQDIKDGVNLLNTQFAVLNERMEQQQRETLRAFAEIEKLEVHCESIAARVGTLEGSEALNRTARGAAWVAAVSLAGMLIISAWDSWNLRLEEKAADVVRRNAESAWAAKHDEATQ